MTTQINIVVDDGGLIQRNKEQTDGNRWLTLEKNGQKLTASKSKEVRDQELAKQGKAPDGKPQRTPPAKPSFRRDEPAAQRQVTGATGIGWGWDTTSSSQQSVSPYLEAKTYTNSFAGYTATGAADSGVTSVTNFSRIRRRAPAQALFSQWQTYTNDAELPTVQTDGYTWQPTLSYSWLNSGAGTWVLRAIGPRTSVLSTYSNLETTYGWRLPAGGDSFVLIEYYEQKTGYLYLRTDHYYESQWNDEDQYFYSLSNGYLDPNGTPWGLLNESWPPGSGMHDYNYFGTVVSVPAPPALTTEMVFTRPGNNSDLSWLAPGGKTFVKAPSAQSPHQIYEDLSVFDCGARVYYCRNSRNPNSRLVEISPTGAFKSFIDYFKPTKKTQSATYRVRHLGTPTQAEGYTDVTYDQHAFAHAYEGKNPKWSGIIENASIYATINSMYQFTDPSTIKYADGVSSKLNGKLREKPSDYTFYDASDNYVDGYDLGKDVEYESYTGTPEVITPQPTLKFSLATGRAYINQSGPEYIKPFHTYDMGDPAYCRQMLSKLGFVAP